MEHRTLLLDEADGVLTLTLNRPDVLNALDLAQWSELADALARAGADPSIRALVLTGAGRAFCAGADIAGMRERRSAAQQTERLALINHAVGLLAALPKPTIAALNGVAAGVGASLALACDLAIAAESASFTFSWIRLGLVPDGGASLLLTRLVGPRRAKDLILSARRVPASEAHEWGMVNEVAPEGQALARAQALARELSGFSPHALRLAKDLVDRSAESTLGEQFAAESAAQAQCVETDEFHTAVAAFLARRGR